MEETQGRKVQEGPQEEEGGVFEKEGGRQEEEDEKDEERDEEEKGLRDFNESNDRCYMTVVHSQNFMDAARNHINYAILVICLVDFVIRASREKEKMQSISIERHKDADT